MPWLGSEIAVAWPLPLSATVRWLAARRWKWARDGAYRQLGWMESPPKVWAETYQVNVISGVRMIQKLVPEMRKARWGRVIQGATKSQRITGIFLQYRGLDTYA